MPIYNTRCAACSKDETRKLSFQQYDQIVSGASALDCECGGRSEVVFEPQAVSFVLRDGEAGGWVSKAVKENKYRAVRRGEMGRRQREHVNPHKLVPNYHGQIADTWAEAKEAAYQSTYERLNREHGAKTAAKVASEAAKTYDKHVKRETL